MSQVHGRSITFHVDGMDPWSDKGEALRQRLLEVTDSLVDQARENAKEIGDELGLEIRVLEIND